MNSFDDGRRRPVLHALIPGLFSAGTDHDVDPSPTQLPLLESCLARADVVEGLPPDVDSQLCSLFGLQPFPDRDLPAGALMREAVCGDAGDSFWLCADPVHIEADHRELFLSAVAPELTAAEAASLCDAINAFGSGEDGTLLSTEPAHWHLRTSRPLSLSTIPLEAVRGGSMRDKMPRGEDGRRWCTWLTEVQMVLHDHPVNRARAAAGKPVVNGLWLWGGGVLPSRRDGAPAMLWDDSLLGRAVVVWAGGVCRPVPATPECWTREAVVDDAGDRVVVLRDLQSASLTNDVAGVHSALAALEGRWLPAFVTALRTRRVAALNLYPGDGRRFSISPGQRWRIWRRSRPLAEWAR
ncbi:MAG: hypothetical protein RBT51_02525 [Ectothiorhodospiraceae bacterium]|jgi:hypothetical protein|nr:hypothetical protein [Ectothiorhodospiraceae bacterium]